MRLLILMVICITSEEVLKNFERIYLTTNESKILKLHDYYSYNEIDFYISNTNMTDNDIKLKHDSSLKLIMHIPDKILNSLYHKPKTNKTFPFISFFEGTFFARYMNNEVYGYFLEKNAEILKEIWKIQIKQNTIFQIARIRLNSGNYYLVLATKVTPNENEIYSISLEDYKKPGIPFKWDLWDIKYLDDLKLSTELSYKYGIAIFGRFKSGKQIVFLYQVLSPQSICLIYSFDNYIGSGEYENADLNIIDVMIFSYKLLLLDSKLGLFIYDYVPYFLNLSYINFIDLRNYGRIHSMQKTENNQQSLPLAISTDSGVVLISSKQINSEFIWINTLDAFGFLAPASYAIIQSQKMFSQVEVNSSYYLMVYEASEILDRNIYQNIANFNLKSIVGDNFDPYGEWMILIYKNKIFYIRNDFDGVKMFLIEAEDWSIEIWGNHSFYVEIVGKSNHKAKKGVKKSFNVISLAAGSYEIYQKPSDISLALSEVHMDYEYDDTIKLNSIFSGPNLIYSIDSFSFPDNFSANISIVQWNYLINEIEIPKNAEIIRFNSFLIAYSIKNEIFIYDLDKVNLIKVLSNFSNIYEFLIITNPDRIAVFEAENLTTKISLCDIYCNDNETCFCFENYSNIKCTFTNILTIQIPHIICANHEAIYIYSTGYQLDEIIIINKELLNLPGELYIIDFEWISSHSYGFPFNIYIYIICNYGVIAFEIEIPTWTTNYKIINNNFPKNYKAIAASSNYIAVAFSDSTIIIYDWFFRYIKTLGPHFDGNTKHIYTSSNLIFLEIDNKIVIYDRLEAAHESLQQVFNIKDSCKPLLNGLRSFKYPCIPIICQFPDKNIMELYFNECKMREGYDCSPQLFINLKLNQNLYTENNEQKGWVSISAKNKHYHLKYELEFNLHTGYDSIWIDNRQLQKKLEIPYNKGEIIDLSQVFHGNNAQASMVVNKIAYEHNEKNYFPAYFWQNFNEIYSGQLPTCDVSSSQVFVANKLIVTSMNEFIIFDTSSIGPKIDAMLSYNAYINSIGINCKDLDAIQFNENIILIFSICIYNPYFTIFWHEKFIKLNQESMYTILIIEYDFIKRISLKTHSIDNIPNFVDFKAVKLSNHRFEIFLYEKCRNMQVGINNYILRYKGNLDENAISVVRHERIDFFSLEISGLSIWSIDIALSKFGQLYLYMIEGFYGLIIVQIHDILPAKIVGGLKHPGLSKFVSTYYFQSNLYIITNKIELYKYSINETLDLKLIKSFYSNSNWPKVALLNSKLLSFQEDCKYIVFANLNILLYHVVLHVWNNDEYFQFSLPTHYQNIKFSGTFLKNNVIAYVDTSVSKLMIYSFNSRYIEIPAMSKVNYEEIVRRWGTGEFYIQLWLENLNQNASSETITLIRSKNYLNFFARWWIWLLISFAIVLFTVISVWILIHLKKRNKREKIIMKDEGLMMEEIKKI